MVAKYNTEHHLNIEHQVHTGKEEPQGLPQMDFSTYSSQIFWFGLSFLILFLFFTKYYLPKIKKVQDDRSVITCDEDNINKDLKNEVDNLQNEFNEKRAKAYKDKSQIEEERDSEIKALEKQYQEKTASEISSINSVLDRDSIKEIDEKEIKKEQEKLAKDIISKISS